MGMGSLPSVYLKQKFLFNAICGVDSFHYVVGPAVLYHGIPNPDFPFGHCDNKVSI